eukprot:Rhum_TRINITY_DN17049_c0_g1::Rhum_TRINITY_DN17049_c0_g1_i1::g.165128::m.165128
MEVVNVRKNVLVKNGYRDLEHWLEDPLNVYIGRDMSRFVKGAVGSKWGNPFSINKKTGANAGLTRDEAVKLYEAHLRKNGCDVTELVGKRLGCWCAPEPCHGHVLQRLIAEATGKPVPEADAPCCGAGATPSGEGDEVKKETKKKAPPKKKARLQ